jgi:hypothetical protein
LVEQFGKRYRIGRDPAYVAEYGPHGRTVDPWAATIPCRYGHV